MALFFSADLCVLCAFAVSHGRSGLRRGVGLSISRLGRVHKASSASSHFSCSLLPTSWSRGSGAAGFTRRRNR